MLKKITFGLFALGMCISSNLIAMQTYMLTAGLNVTYELEPNEPIELYNFAFWTINAVCSIETNDESDTISATVLKQTAILNGKDLSKGDTFNIDVHSGDKLKITAVSGAKVKLINQGNHTVTANCSA